MGTSEEAVSVCAPEMRGHCEGQRRGFGGSAAWEHGGRVVDNVLDCVAERPAAVVFVYGNCTNPNHEAAGGTDAAGESAGEGAL